MRKFPIALQLYSVREQAKEDLVGTLKAVADAGYVGVELAGLYDLAPTELRKMLDDLGLKVTSNHGATPNAENRNEILEMAEALGYSYHISGRGRDQFATEEECVESGRVFQAAAEALKGSGISYGIHNHWWEFSNEFNGRTGHEIALAEAPDIFAQVDTYWVKVGGKDPAEVISKLGPRVPLLHIKDGPLDREKSMTAVGDGKMDWKHVMSAVDEDALQCLIVELDRCDTDMIEAVTKSAKFLVDEGYGVGK